MSPDAALSLRPLLRFPSLDFSPQVLAAQGFGGIVLDANALEASPSSAEFAAACRAQNLEVWLDVSELSFGKRDDLARWNLEFDGAHPRLARSSSACLDPFHAESVAVILETLSRFPIQALTGVLCAWRWDYDDRALPPFPWSKALENKIDAASLPALVSNTGDNAARTRQNFWNALAQLSGENATRLRAWCATRQLQFCARRFAPELEALHLDEKFRARLDPDYPALLTGDCPADVLRATYQFLHAGATRFQIEAAPRALPRGAKLLHEALSSAAQKMASSRNAARVGVLFPARSCQTHYHPDGHRLLRWVADDLRTITQMLDDLHFDWMFVEEKQIMTGSIEDEALRCNGLALEMIVVPSVTALDARTFSVMEKLVENGGKVACLGLLPRWSENGRDRDWEAQVGKAALLSVEDLYAAYAAHEDGAPLPPTLGFPVFREHISGGRLCCYQPRLNLDADDARLRVHQILHESLAPDFETQSPHIIYCHCTNEKGDEFFIFNNGTETRHINARLRPALENLKDLKILALDAATGEEKSLAVWMPHPLEQGGGLSLSLDLAPGEARFLRIEVQDKNGETKLQTLNLERASFEVEYFDGALARGYATQSGAQKLALRADKKLQWHESEAVQVPAPILLADEWQSERDQTSLTFAAPVEIPAAWENHRVFLEIAFAPCVVELRVNDCALPPRIAPPLRFDVTSTLRAGELNHFVAHCECGACEESEGKDENFLARLAAYPVVEIATRQTP